MTETTKAALISDIHGNAIALENVLKEIKQQGIDQLFIAGDFVGYYYDHKKVFNLLDDFKWQGVQGNHDAALLFFLTNNKQTMEKYRSSFGTSLDKALQVLTKQQIERLISLPKKKEIVLAGKKILMCHGAPWDRDEYIYPDAGQETFERVFNLDYDFVILGHTHHPLLKKRNKRVIINPGSVGQPRNKGGSASWAAVDFSTGQIRQYYE